MKMRAVGREPRRAAVSAVWGAPLSQGTKGMSGTVISKKDDTSPQAGYSGLQLSFSSVILGKPH